MLLFTQKLILTTHHIFIGAVYILCGLIGGSFGFGLSIIIRLELALPGYVISNEGFPYRSSFRE
jgi:heme/copper-type cytochrome/quinol oxidase subunit 1